MEESFPMKGGDGPNSYFKNSSHQKEGIDGIKTIFDAAIAEKLETKQDSLSTSNSFRIVDMGCSVGPNTFFAVRNIIEAVELKYQTQGLSSHLPEFQVFFNDHVGNDFNTLFSSLPSERRYFVAGTPGSFHGRLFPAASIDFVHSSSALQWMSRVPKEVLDVNCPAFNKGRIDYMSASEEVGKAYSAQYANDMESFLNARAEELVPGGLITLLIPARPNGTLPRDYSLGPVFKTLESSLIDMVNMGVVSEDKLDSFNLPIYAPSMEELETLVERNGCLSLEVMEPVEALKKALVPSAQVCRAGLESLISNHFGTEIIEKLFDRYTEKIAEPSETSFDDNLALGLFVLIKRKVTK